MPDGPREEADAGHDPGAGRAGLLAWVRLQWRLRPGDGGQLVLSQQLNLRPHLAQLGQLGHHQPQPGQLELRELRPVQSSQSSQPSQSDVHQLHLLAEPESQASRGPQCSPSLSATQVHRSSPHYRAPAPAPNLLPLGAPASADKPTNPSHLSLHLKSKHPDLRDRHLLSAQCHLLQRILLHLLRTSLHHHYGPGPHPSSPSSPRPPLLHLLLLLWGALSLPRPVECQSGHPGRLVTAPPLSRPRSRPLL